MTFSPGRGNKRRTSSRPKKEIRSVYETIKQMLRGETGPKVSRRTVLWARTDPESRKQQMATHKRPIIGATTEAEEKAVGEYNLWGGKQKWKKNPKRRPRINADLNRRGNVKERKRERRRTPKSRSDREPRDQNSKKNKLIGFRGEGKTFIIKTLKTRSER